MKKTARKKDKHAALRNNFARICDWIDEHGREPNPKSKDLAEFHVGVMLLTLRQEGAAKGWLEVLYPLDRHGLLPRRTAVEPAPVSPVQ